MLGGAPQEHAVFPEISNFIGGGVPQGIDSN
jgi:hypothetical protein